MSEARIIEPTPALCEHILNYNVPLDYPAWDGNGHSYDKDDFVTYGGCGFFVYQSLTNHVSDPDVTPDKDPTNWLLIGTSNYWSMFDQSNTTQTSYLDSIEIEIDIVSQVNSVAIINVDAIEARFEAWDFDDTKIVDETISLRDYGVSDFYEYFYEDWTFLTNYVSFQVPTILTGRGKLTLTAASGGTAKIGSLVYGKSIAIGDTQYGVSLGLRDFSNIIEDDFGNTTIVKRGFKNRVDADIVVSHSNTREVRRKLLALRATPIVLSLDESKTYLTEYGIIRDFQVILSNPSFNECSLQFESML